MDRVLTQGSPPVGVSRNRGVLHMFCDLHRVSGSWVSPCGAADMRQYRWISGLLSGFTLTFADRGAGSISMVVGGVVILPAGVVCGTLNKLGVGYGVQIDTL